MANIEDRVVSLSYESSKFESGISASLTSLQKLSDTLKKVGSDSGLENIEKSANKINFLGLGTAIDKLKAKFGFKEATDAFSGIEKDASRVEFDGLTRNIDQLKGKFNFPEADQGFANIERASGKVTFTGLQNALSGITKQFGIMEAAVGVTLGNLATKAITAGSDIGKGLSVEPITGGFKEYETQLNAVQTILANTKASGAGLKDVNKALLQLNHYADKTIYNFTEMTRNIGTFTAAGVDLDTATASIKGIANLAALSGSNSQQAATAMYQLSQAISSGRVSLQDWNSVVNAGMGGTVFQRALAQTAVQMGTLKDSAVELKGKMKNVTIEGSSFRESIMAKPGEDSWLTKEVLLGTLKQFTGDMTDAELAAQGFSKAQIKAIQIQAKTAQDAATKVKTLTQLLDTAKEAAGSGWAQTWQIVFGNFGEAKQLFTGLSNSLNGWISNSAKARNAVLKDWKALGGRKILIEGIINIFKGLGSILKPIRDAFRDIFPAKTGKDLLELTKNFRDFTDSIKISFETSNDLKRTFSGFFAVLDIGKQIVSGIFDVFKMLFHEVGKGSGGFLEFTGGIGDSLVDLDKWLKKGDRLKNFFHAIGEVIVAPIKALGQLKDVVTSLFDGIEGNSLDTVTDAFKRLGEAIKPSGKAIETLKKAWDGLVHFLSGVVDAIRPAIDAVVDVFRSIGEKIADALHEADYDKVFQIIQTTLIGGIFLAIKKAFTEGLNFDFGGKALSSVTTAMSGLTDTMSAMQTRLKAGTLTAIAVAVGLLTASIAALSLIDPGKLTKALTAMSAGLFSLLASMTIMAKQGGFILAPIMAAAMLIMASAMDVLAVAVFALSHLKWEELVKGLVGVSGLLVGLAKTIPALAKAGPALLPVGLGLVGVALSLNLMAGAMKIFGTMDWEEIAKGLSSVIIGLAGLRSATKGMGIGLVLVGPGLIAVGIALTSIAGAMKIFATISWEDTAKGLLAVVGALTGIRFAMTGMPLTLPIMAAGLVLVGLALLGISGAIAIMGNMNWGTIGKGLVAIGGALVVLAAGLTAMVLSGPGAIALLAAAGALAILAPTLVILGHMQWSTLLKGLAAMVLSIGALAVVGGLAGPALVVLGLGIAALGLGILAVGKGTELFVKAILLLGSDGAKGIGVFMAAFAAMVAVIPKIIIDFIKGLVAISAEIVKLAPEIVKAMTKITIMLLDVLIKSAPKAAEAITALIKAILKVLADNAGPIVRAGAKLLVDLLRGLSSHIGDIVNAAANLIVKFLTALANKTPDIVKAGAKLLVKFLEGIANNIGKVGKAATDVAIKFINTVATQMLRLANEGAKAVIRFINGVADAIRKHTPDLIEACGNLALAMIEGVARGLIGIPAMLLEKLIQPVQDAWNSVISFISDPGKIMQIENTVGPAIERLGDAMAEKFRRQREKLAAAAKERGVASTFESMLRPDTQALINSPEIQAALASLPKTLVPAFKKVYYGQSKEWMAAGTYVLNGFLHGLTGSQSDINAAVSELSSRLTSTVQSLRAKVKAEEGKIKQLEDKRESLSHQKQIDAIKNIIAKRKEDGDSVTGLEAKLKKLRAEKEKNKKAIDNINSAVDKHNVKLGQNAHMLSIGLLAQKQLNKTLSDGKSDLLALAKEYDSLNKQMEKAKATLEEATAARDEARKSYREQYSTLPDIDLEAENPLGKYTQTLKDQVIAIGKYKETLDKLLTLGLDDTTYKKLLEGGTANQVFANQLLAGGPAAVQALKELDGQLDTAAKGLAYTASQKLYQAGVDAATEIINGIGVGLKAKKKAIEVAMDEIAKLMVRAMKAALGIKSPSKVFAQMGKYSMDGMAKGMLDSSKAVVLATESVGDDALAAMRDKMTTVSSLLANEIDANPTITPILDLTQVRSDLATLSNVIPITAAASYGQAMSISAATQISSSENADISEKLAQGLQLVQNNYSPKALSETEIYRQTSNQLSQAKSILGLP